MQSRGNNLSDLGTPSGHQWGGNPRPGRQLGRQRQRQRQPVNNSQSTTASQQLDNRSIRVEAALATADVGSYRAQRSSPPNLAQGAALDRPASVAGAISTTLGLLGTLCQESRDKTPTASATSPTGRRRRALCSPNMASCGDPCGRIRCLGMLSRTSVDVGVRCAVMQVLVNPVLCMPGSGGG